VYLQRLFSTFPDGWPGAGLLLLRLAAGAILIHHGILGLPDAHAVPLAWRCCAAAVGLLLLPGLWTPIAGVLVGILEVWMALARPSELCSSFLLAALGIGLAMLGPGAWSIDARLCGRKRIEIRAR
jgi:putative oxidoreductase